MRTTTHTHTHTLLQLHTVGKLQLRENTATGLRRPMAHSEEPAGHCERERERGGKGYIDAAPACKLIAIVELIGRQNMHTTTAAATLKKQKRHFVVFIVLVFVLACFLQHFFFVVLIKFVFPLHIFGGFLFFFFGNF